MRYTVTEEPTRPELEDRLGMTTSAKFADDLDVIVESVDEAEALADDRALTLRLVFWSLTSLTTEK